MSLSSRRAWIEMLIGHTVHTTFKSRSPHGERGLKSLRLRQAWQTHMSLSSRRAWIEIWHPRRKRKDIVSLSSRRAWIEIIIL